MNLWGISVLCLASNAPKGRKLWHLPTSTAQVLQSLFAVDPSIHSFQGCFLWSCSSASFWRHKVERSQWIIRSPTAGLSKCLLLIFPLLLSFCSACNKSLCPLLFKLQPRYWKREGAGDVGKCWRLLCAEIKPEIHVLGWPILLLIKVWAFVWSTGVKWNARRTQAEPKQIGKAAGFMQEIGQMVLCVSLSRVVWAVGDMMWRCFQIWSNSKLGIC